MLKELTAKLVFAVAALSLALPLAYAAERTDTAKTDQNGQYEGGVGVHGKTGADVGAHIGKFGADVGGSVGGHARVGDVESEPMAPNPSTQTPAK